MNIQMKATEQYFPVVLLILVRKVALTFDSVNEILKSHGIQVKANGSYFCAAVFYAVQGGSNF